MTVFLTSMPERPATPTPPAAEMEPYPDPENRVAWAKAKYERMKAQTGGGARPSWVDPGGVVAANIQREAAANRPRGPFGPVKVDRPMARIRR